MSISTVRRAIAERGIERPRGAERKLPKPGENYEVDQAFASGMSYPDIARMFGVSLSTVNRGAAMRKAQHASQETGEIHTTSDIQEATEEHPYGYFIEDGKEIDLDPNGNVPLREHNEW